MLLYLAAPVLHAVLEVGGEQVDDAINQLFMLLISVHGVLAADLEFRALQHPGEQPRVDSIFLSLCWFERNATEPAGLVHES